ncbi:MAG: sodium:calcium antiporter, partial [Bacteroidota bacterium]
IALVLGLVAVAVKQIDLDYNVWHIDMPYLWGSAFFLYFVLMDFHLSAFECLLFITAIIIFLAYSFKGDEEREQQEKIKTTWRSYVMLLVGGIGVAAGAHFTIEAITQLSLMANIDSDVISLSAVALGTSLPEVIVSLNAARKGKTSIAVGNVLGSNIFNTYCVMAIPGLMGTLEIPTDILTFSL